MSADSRERRPNRLAGETSPYLLQHRFNPVDWYPWGAEALERARTGDLPIFLSIGYAACHWCHVMERESFEDAEIAAFLNRHFVAIKVDREERPDVDEIYMNAVQMMTGAGGWPLSAFLTPELEPFLTGTYFPPTTRHGRIGLLELLHRVQEAWGGRREEIRRSARHVHSELVRVAEGIEPGTTPIGRAEQARAVAEWTARFDSRWGGFGGAPKFPPDGAIAVLLREHEREGDAVPRTMALATLDAMARGGLYDQIGGGFARYSVDERWLVPHFEKMLYNQATLVPLYVDAWRLTADARYRRVAEETLDFVRRELTGPEGGFLASLDADSEGEEGRFYVFRPEEVAEVLGEPEASRLCEVYGITDAGNFEGRSISNLLGGAGEDAVVGLREARARLLAARERRVRPATDDKVLTSWNGLMISAFARAWQAFGRPVDLETARSAAAFVEANLVRDGRALVVWRAGQARLAGYLDDHAFLARALVDLYESDFDPAHLALAERLVRTMLERFADPERGDFFFVADDHERLPARNRSSHDGALPSGAGVAIESLVRLAAHLDDATFRAAADRALAAYRPRVERMPSAFASMLVAADLARGPFDEVAIVGDDPAEVGALVAAARRRFRPRLAVAAGRPGEAPGPRALLAGKTPAAGRATAWICRASVCGPPLTDPDELERRLDARAS